jgi:hypothetical protein
VLRPAEAADETFLVELHRATNPRAARFYVREGFCFVADTDTHVEYVFPATSGARA